MSLDKTNISGISRGKEKGKRMEYKCPKCRNEQSFFTKEVGKHTGLYCSKCGRYIKWLGKKEYAEFIRKEAQKKLSFKKDWDRKEKEAPLLSSSDGTDLEEIIRQAFTQEIELLLNVVTDGKVTTSDINIKLIEGRFLRNIGLSAIHATQK